MPKNWVEFSLGLAMSTISDECSEIEDISVRVFSLRGGRILRDKPREFGRDLPEYVECANPRCSRGRFRVWPVIRVAASRHDETFEKRNVCNGSEGRGRPCLYTFEVEGEITYKT